MRRSAETRNSNPKANLSSGTAAGTGPIQIVGVGASAGGLEALRSLVTHLDNSLCMSVIVVQHLAPKHRSMLAELLSRETRLEVREIQDGDEPQPNIIYITPPNADVTIKNGKLRLTAPHSSLGPKPSIDLFFESLANDVGENAVGIILSGTGSDGAQGIRAIKAAGGMTMAQEVSSAKYDGMPMAAIGTGSVDIVLPPEKIASELAQLKLRSSQLSHIENNDPQSDPYKRILAILRREMKVDFANYKQSTIRRRLHRRMLATKVENLEEYLGYIERNPSEIRTLFQDILISVTAFFRDPEAYRALAPFIKNSILEKSGREPFRIWVPGCATGEEAYSLAIMASEIIRKTGRDLRIQVFATDLDEEGMAIGRKAIYPESSLAPMKPEIRKRYFVRTGDGYQIQKNLREQVIFARHNLIEDPPFLKLDLISCRNVFIYFDNDIQSRILKTFHYGLCPGGILFLGKSESIGQGNSYFESVNQKNKIFLRNSRKVELPAPFGVMDLQRRPGAGKNQIQKLAPEVINSLISAVAPDSIIVDSAFQLRYVFGRAHRFLTFSAGEVSQYVQRLISPELRTEITTLLHRCQKEQKNLTGRRIHVPHGKRSEIVQLHVSPLPLQDQHEYLVRFTISDVKKESEPVQTNIRNAGARIRDLEQELAATREHLQTVVEELETSNEELQALNEELQSSNEELQSSNEELETSNEELQATNEELTTLNQEINVKSNERVELNDQLEKIQDAINYPLIVVDKNVNLIRFNSATASILKLSGADRGKPLRMLQSLLDLEMAYKAIEKAIANGKELKTEIETGGRIFELKVQPIFGPNKTLYGAVASFVDTSEIVNAMRKAQSAEEKLASILNFTPAVVSVKDVNGRYQLVNRRFCEIAGKKPDEIIGKSDDDIFSSQVSSEIRERDFEVLKRRTALEFEEVIPMNGSEVILLSSRFPLLDENRVAQSICTISLDVTKRVENERALSLFKQAISSSKEGLLILEDQGGFKVTFANDSFYRIMGYRASEIEGKSLSELFETILDQGVEDVRQLEASISKGQRDVFISEGRRKSGEAFWQEVRVTYSEGQAEEPTKIILMIMDISDRKRQEDLIQVQQLNMARAARLSALGEMAAGIAHEMNTPLNAILGHVDILEQLANQDKLDTKSVLDAAKEVERTVNTLSKIITGLRSVARMDQSESFIREDLRMIVSNTLQLCDFNFKKNRVQLQVSLPSHPIEIMCQPTQLVQVLINILNNAIDAVRETSHNWVKLEVSENDHAAQVRVTDGGSGIPEHIAEKIMMPFFTTKSPGHGTGIGLSISQNIIKAHGGSLGLDRQSKNTSFVVALPKDLKRRDNGHETNLDS